MSEVSTYSLEPFKGKPGTKGLLHLLRRCLFGSGHKEISFFTGKNINECIDILLTPSATPEIPIQEDSDIIDPLVPKGEIWVNAPYESDLIDNRRGLLLKMWWVGQIINRDNSLTEKMTLFWHNHFVTEMDIVKDSRYSYRYIAMLRHHALGNFKELINEGTSNLAMLVYLNGNSNNKTAPNENYSRELMELFTLGKGAEAYYNEEDVKKAARVLSGWYDDKETISVRFNSTFHDERDKEFSNFFDNQVVAGKKGVNSAEEIKELIDMIFRKDQTAKFVCRNLYRWFASAQIDDTVEKEIITPLAQIFIAHNFEIIPVLKKLLSSEHFFDPALRGCIVKSPVDFLLGAVQQFDLITTAHLNTKHEPWLQFYFSLGDLSMDIGNPPSVAGWPAYYQAPKYHQWWINSASLGLRTKILHEKPTTEGMEYNGTNLSFNFIEFVRKFNNTGNPDRLIDKCVELLLAIEISSESKLRLKKELLSGQQSEHYWTEAWDKFYANPGDEANRSIVEVRLRAFFKKIFNMPEYQMM